MLSTPPRSLLIFVRKNGRIIAYNYVFKPQVFTLTNLSGVKPRQDLGQNGVEDMIQLT